MGRTFSYSLSSSSSASSIRSRDRVNGNFGIPRRCFCHGRIVLNTSTDLDEPNRLYYTCENEDASIDRKHVFKWWDAAILDEFEDLRHLVQEGENRLGCMLRFPNGDNVDPPCMWNQVTENNVDINHLKEIMNEFDVRIDEVKGMVLEMEGNRAARPSGLGGRNALLIMVVLAVFAILISVVMANLQSLPHHLVLYIVSLVAQAGFHHLGPLIASGSEGASLAFNEYVLKATSITMIEDHPHVVNINSYFRSFFERTIRARNPTAMYLESLRMVARDGLYGDAIACEEDEGIAVMDKFRKTLDAEKDVEDVSGKVFHTMPEIVYPCHGAVCSNATYCERRCSALSRFKKKIPFNFEACDKCTEAKRCPPCYAWWRCGIFKGMFCNCV
ncbi:unnamed protein product [Arabidopsis lyrata]|nr:unnamed protein product [Arabidopsis lyrata]